MEYDGTEYNPELHKRYWHELSDEEVKAIPPETLCSELAKRYKQPDWCSYPDAVDVFGCWSLVGLNRTKISREFCGSCEVFKK